MAHVCGCRSGAVVNEEGRSLSGRTVRAEQRVGEVARDYPGAREVMQDLGINHCCGAELTLAEAAASAGVALGRLLDALNERTVPAP